MSVKALLQLVGRGAMVCALVLATRWSAAGPIAGVEVLNRGPTSLVEGDSTSTWRYLPDFIRGSTIYSVPLVPLPGDNPASGKAHFKITQSGTLYIAAAYDYQGNASGGWIDEQTTRPELEAEGWSYTADMRYGDGRVFRLFEKQVTAGSEFALRVNKYVPPFAITETPQTGSTPSQAAPWPEYGPVAVADFTPVSLGDPISGFTNVPAELVDSLIFSQFRRPSGAISDFRALADTKLLLAAHFGYEGTDEGDWDDDALSLADLLAQGWTKVGQMQDSANDRTWDILEKNVQAGDTFSLRVNKYSAPYVIVAAVPEPSTLMLALCGALALGLGKWRLSAKCRH
jgi:hypothetical protein